MNEPESVTCARVMLSRLCLLLFLPTIPSVLGFTPLSSSLGVPSHPSLPPQSTFESQTGLCLITESDVLSAVDKAEQLWAEALDARETADALSHRAEEEAEAARELSESVSELYRNMKSISLESIAKADAATVSSLDANSMLTKALEACRKADALEQQAEQALTDTEEKLKQHLLDFPDSPLAE